MKNRRIVAAIVGIVTLGTVLGACSTSSDDEPKPAARPAFVERLKLPGGDYGLPTPFASNPRGPGTVNVNFVFDTLLWKDSTGNVIPWLAESWTRSPDALEYRFTLRPNVLWQDGKPLTAEDVKFTFEYMTTGAGKAAPSSIFSSIPGATITTEGTNVVVIKLTKPFSPFEVTIAGRVAILPKHIWEPVTDPVKFTGPEATTGSGPYKLESYNPATGEYAFQANESYFLGVPYVRRLEFVQAPNQLLALGQGGLDLASPGTEEGYPEDALAVYRNDPKYGIITAPGEWNRALHFNLTKGFPFNDKKFRQAVAYAVDRKDLVKRILLGQGVPGSMGDLAPSNLYAELGLPTYDVDTNKAKALLDEIGMTDANGDGVRDLPTGEAFAPELLITAASAKPAELIKEYLRDAGINLQIKSVDAAASDSAVTESRFEMALVGYGALGSDPDWLRQRLSSKVPSKSFLRIQGWNNPSFEDAAAKQLVTVDPAERLKLVHQMQRAVAEDVPVMALYLSTRTAIFNKTVFSDWYYTPQGVFGLYPHFLNKHALATGKTAGV